MAFKKFDEAYHGLGPDPIRDTFADPANSNIQYPDKTKLDSFIDDIKYLCESYGYTFNHDIKYQKLEDPQTWKTIVSAILEMKVTAR